MKDGPRSRTVTWADPKPGARRAREMSGFEFFDQMRRGKINAPPFVHLLGMEVFDAGEGRFAMTLDPQECHYNPMGCVHGGVLSTLLDSVMSAAVHTALPAGRGYMTLEIKVNFIRPVFAGTGLVMAEGKVVSCGRHVATAEGRIVDVNQRLLSTGTATCLLFDMPRGGGPRMNVSPHAARALAEPGLRHRRGGVPGGWRPTTRTRTSASP